MTTRLSLLACLALALVAPVAGAPFDLYEYALIAQQPDGAKAVRCPASVDFAAGCSAFSASTAGVVFPTRPVAWVQFMATVTAHHVEDAVRLRAFRYVLADGDWTTVSEAWVGTAPTLLDAPRTVGYYLDPAWWAEQPAGETIFVLEMRGSPTVYGAKLRVAFDLGAGR
ncbi:hypothetical protein [Luteitalea sp.]|uniref:hypothetical protein n=1 Tax=Luteitalea sp. TaxID=2004800 RepID=UPI0025C46A3B|nr:hypothetical protein [Luteitalea sp.]